MIMTALLMAPHFFCPDSDCKGISNETIFRLVALHTHLHSLALLIANLNSNRTQYNGDPPVLKPNINTLKRPCAFQFRDIFKA